jgi:4-amino-4-deoxy-L-arabinose transferase-like glycosyltransferase
LDSDQSLSPRCRALAYLSLAAGLYLYLGGLDRLPLQRGNEPMYAVPPIWMLERGEYLVPHYEGGPFLQKPPLTWWILAASYELFGVSVFAARLPSALAALATVLLVGLWVRRRSGIRAGWLAALILMFSFSFLQLSVTFAADAFLTLAITIAVVVLDAAARREDGSDAAWGLKAAAALALAFYFKGLVGIILPAGSVAAGLLLDRKRPVRMGLRGGVAAVILLALLAPWHWAMHQRLGVRFWRAFYWENQFLRGASTLYMRQRGPLYYPGILVWAVFPWSPFLPGSLRRREPSSAPLGWFAFTLLFWTLVVQKREVYLLTLFPAVAALVAESLGRGPAPASRWSRLPWALSAGAAGFALALWMVALRGPAALAGEGPSLLVALGIFCLAAALTAGAAAPRSEVAPFAAAFACAVLLGAMQVFESRLARFDPMPRWGAAIRAQCAGGCDVFLYRIHAYSLDFYSRLDWTVVPDLSAELTKRVRQQRGFLVMPTDQEAALADFPFRFEVLDRSPILDKSWLAAALGRSDRAFRSLSLVRFERPRPPASGLPGSHAEVRADEERQLRAAQ